MNSSEFWVILVLALVLIGPKRLPVYAAVLTEWVKKVRAYAMDAKSQVSQELGPEFKDVDWQQYDPRQYDPRRIVREALTAPLDDDSESSTEGNARTSKTAARLDSNGERSTPPPFDHEAT